MTLPYTSGHIPLQESQQSAVIELNKATKLDAYPRRAPQPEPYARATFLRAMEMHVDDEAYRAVHDKRLESKLMLGMEAAEDDMKIPGEGEHMHRRARMLRGPQSSSSKAVDRTTNAGQHAMSSLPLSPVITSLLHTSIFP